MAESKAKHDRLHALHVAKLANTSMSADEVMRFIETGAIGQPMQDLTPKEIRLLNQSYGGE